MVLAFQPKKCIAAGTNLDEQATRILPRLVQKTLRLICSMAAADLSRITDIPPASYWGLVEEKWQHILAFSDGLQGLRLDVGRLGQTLEKVYKEDNNEQTAGARPDILHFAKLGFRSEVNLILDLLRKLVMLCAAHVLKRT